MPQEHGDARSGRATPPDGNPFADFARNATAASSNPFAALSTRLTPGQVPSTTSPPEDEGPPHQANEGLVNSRPGAQVGRRITPLGNESQNSQQGVFRPRKPTYMDDMQGRMFPPDSLIRSPVGGSRKMNSSQRHDLQSWAIEPATATEDAFKQASSKKQFPSGKREVVEVELAQEAYRRPSFQSASFVDRTIEDTADLNYSHEPIGRPPSIPPPPRAPDGGPPGAGPSWGEQQGEYRDVLLRTTAVEKRKKGWMTRVLICLGLASSLPTSLYCSNEVTTSKYTVLTFLPRNLLEQFRRAANLYFLLTVILQLVPGLSPVPWYTTFAPLAFVLMLNMFKELYDDIGRHRNDEEVNHRMVTVLRENDKETQQISWKNVRVGDLLRINLNEDIPADMVLLSSSDPDDLCYVETANLDGETNLKVRYCYPATTNCDLAKKFSTQGMFLLQCEHPNSRLYVFEGTIYRVPATFTQALVNSKYADLDEETAGIQEAKAAIRHGSGVTKHPLDASNLLLRGCILRKTDWVVGVVVFTGKDTKIVRNMLPPSHKVTQLERHMNLWVKYMFGLLLSLAVLLSAGSWIWTKKEGTRAWYLGMNKARRWPELEPGFDGFLVQIVRFLLLMSQAIPISLYVTLEMVKVLQCNWLLNQDLAMYYPPLDTPFKCRTTTLNEDLGQVEYVLSDKTGTLTQNIMGFVWASIGGQLYGTSGSSQWSATMDEFLLPEVDVGRKFGEPKRSSMKSSRKFGLSSLKASPAVPADTPHTIARDSSIHQQLASGNVDVRAFLSHLMICNTVVPTVNDQGQLLYQAASPDEEALVQGAAYLGFKLLSRTSERVECEVDLQVVKYDILAVLEFTSDRKRMSVVCRGPDKVARVLVKGADNVILERLSADNQKALAATNSHLKEMSEAGYRTLCVAERVLTDEELQDWLGRWHEATTALDYRDEKMAEVAALVEGDLTLLGATAVEDKLQDGVPEAIAMLKMAGIKVWVLTGDKVETAISIAHTCRLFNSRTTLHRIAESDLVKPWRPREEDFTVEEGLQQKLREILHDKRKAGNGLYEAGLVIDGHALALALRKENRRALITLCKECNAVVCCRVSPMQKAQVTKLVRKEVEAVTLAIGDGANDVPMIQAAHIGCGISGREGRAAVLSSDFSFAQFAYLTRLLLVHGRWTYKRNLQVVTFAFYKNWTYVLCLALFSFFCGFSAEPIFHAAYIATFNMFWAALATIAYGFFEQDVSAETVLKHPHVYRETQQMSRWSFLRTVLLWMLLGTWHAACVFFVPLFTLSEVDSEGRHGEFHVVGTAIFTAVVIVVNMKLALFTHYWTWVNHVVVWGALVCIIPFFWALGSVPPTTGTLVELYGLGQQLFGSAMFWLGTVILAPGLALLPDMALQWFQEAIRPQLYQRLQMEEAKQGKVRQDEEVPPEEPEAMELKEFHTPKRRTSIERLALVQGTPRSDQPDMPLSPTSWIPYPDSPMTSPPTPSSINTIPVSSSVLNRCRTKRQKKPAGGEEDDFDNA